MAASRGGTWFLRAAWKSHAHRFKSVKMTGEMSHMLGHALVLVNAEENRRMFARICGRFDNLTSDMVQFVAMGRNLSFAGFNSIYVNADLVRKDDSTVEDLARQLVHAYTFHLLRTENLNRCESAPVLLLDDCDAKGGDAGSNSVGFAPNMSLSRSLQSDASVSDNSSASSSVHINLCAGCLMERYVFGAEKLRTWHTFRSRGVDGMFATSNISISF